MAQIDSATDKLIFSVILTTCNRADLVVRAIDSILKQTFIEFELIIVDDASTDATPEVVAAIADSHIIYLRQPSNGGVGLARNRGIQSAKGEYIVFVDDDDTIAPTFLTEVYATLSQAPTTVGFLLTWKDVVRQIESGTQKLGLHTFGRTTTTPLPGTNFLENLAGASSGLVVRADAIRAVGAFNPELRAVGDTELLIRLAKCFDYIVIPLPLYQLFTAHGEQLTKPSLVRAQAYERIIELHEGWLQQYPGTLTVLYKGAARMYYQIGNRSKARQYMKWLIRYQPFNWRNWVLLFLLESMPILPNSISRRIMGYRFA